MIRAYSHLALHFLVPGMVAWLVFRRQFGKAWVTMCATMLVDVDHILADPVYDPSRCSIGFHPLHRYPLIAGYAAMAFWPKLRLVGLGLLIHMGLDAIDCVWMSYE